jgi:hypothetical protein
MRLGLEDTGPPLPAEALERFEYVVEAKAGTRTLTRKATRLAADPLRPGVGRRASVPAGAMPAAMWGRTPVGGHLSLNAVFFPHVTDALVILLLAEAPYLLGNCSFDAPPVFLRYSVAELI